MSCVSVKDLIGCKYKVHGRSKEEGFDCLGIDIEVLRRNGIEIPDINYKSPEQYESVFIEEQKKVEYRKVERPCELAIIVFKVRGEPTHTGIYLGEGLFIHATKGGVRVEPLHRWENRVEGYYVCICKNHQESV